MLKTVSRIRTVYEHYERFTPVAFFCGGFTWDSVTLKRIDQIFDNLILLFYLIALGALIFLVAMLEKGKLQKPFLLKHRKWFPLALQFFLGGLFSAYVIFYFQSASFSTTAIFLGLLVLLLVANEFLQNRLANLNLVLALYFLACFSFFIFFTPVLLRIMNIWTFILGGIMSLAVVYGLIWFLHRKDVLAKKAAVGKGGLVLSLYLILNVFYFLNWIPPVPLSLKSGGIYHRADRAGEQFVLSHEKPKWYQILKSSDATYHYSPGDTVYCFTAVFAPTELTKKIFHHWQKYFSEREEWVTTDRLGFEITGYRDGGYRGITRKVNVSEGDWRVDVETEWGVLLGRIGFEIALVSKQVPLKSIYR